MFGVTFAETLRRHWRQAIYWGLSLGALGWIQIIFVPDAKALKQIGELMETLPPALVKVFAGDDITFMSTPDGYLATQFFSYGLLIFAAFAVVIGLNVTAADEDRGILDMTLSLPINRWQVIIEKFLAFLLLIVLVTGLTFAGLWIGVTMTPAIEYNLGVIATGIVNLLPGTIFVLSVTILLGALIRRRSTVTALAAGFVIGSYFLDTLAAATDSAALSTLRLLSFYRYYNGVEVMRLGISWVNIALLLGISAVLIFVAVWAFQRRDVGI